MTARVECPICMEPIESNKNNIITECGHCFHAKCLMTNAAINGFNCPYCRTQMANETESSDDESSEYESVEGYLEVDTDYTEHVLNGARWLFQRAEGEEVDEDDDGDSILAEEEDEEESSEVPHVDYFISKMSQHSITNEDLIKFILLNTQIEYQEHASFRQSDNMVYGFIRHMITSYRAPSE